MNEDGLTPEELQAENAVALPDKEVVSILDLNADVDILLDVASPIDLAVAANLNVAAPINAAAGANLLSDGSIADAGSQQGVELTQDLAAPATATSNQVSVIGQGDEVTPTEEIPDEPESTDLLDGNLLDVDVDVDLDGDLAAPINGAVAANANIAAPINASVAANIDSDGSTAASVAVQDAVINQSITGDGATATADQDSTVSQGDAAATDGTTTGGTAG